MVRRSFTQRMAGPATVIKRAFSPRRRTMFRENIRKTAHRMGAIDSREKKELWKTTDNK